MILPLIAFILSYTYFEMNKDNLIADLIKNGENPIVVSCALNKISDGRCGVRKNEDELME